MVTSHDTLFEKLNEIRLKTINIDQNENRKNISKNSKLKNIKRKKIEMKNRTKHMMVSEQWFPILHK